MNKRNQTSLLQTQTQRRRTQNRADIVCKNVPCIVCVYLRGKYLTADYTLHRVRSRGVCVRVSAALPIDHYAIQL